MKKDVNIIWLSVVVIAILMSGACNNAHLKKDVAFPQVKQEPFGTTPDGQKVDLYTLTNANGMQIKIMNYGAAITSVIVPDRNGKFEDIVPGYDNFDGYLKANPYFGGIVGRFGNRIAKGKFTLDGIEYTLAANNNGNHLHGGNIGFDKVVWNARPFKTGNSVGVKLDYLSKDGEEGYPGNLNVTVTYTLTNNRELKIDYTATTDKATPVNLTQHGYWNLAGAGNGDILSHVMMINADRFTPTDATSIPTGQLAPVKDTPMDFTKPTAIGFRINEVDEQLNYGKGYDHNWVLNKTDNAMTLACRVSEPTNGRVMEIYTSEPGLQFYSGNFLDGTIKGKYGKVYNYRDAIVLETQHFPDSPNHPNFPSTILRPGEKYDTHTIYRFSVE
jgi:aldose 1-epimerase